MMREFTKYFLSARRCEKHFVSEQTGTLSKVVTKREREKNKLVGGWRAGADFQSCR